jgi:hypothetical protein
VAGRRGWMVNPSFPSTLTAPVFPPSNMFDHIRAADRVVLLLNTLLLMAVAFLPFATSVLAGALRSGDGQRTAVAFYGIACDVTALTFNAVWQYARRHHLLRDALDFAGATAISRRFELALGWLTSGALLGAVLPVFGVVVRAAFNAFTGFRSGARVHAREPPEASHGPAFPTVTRGDLRLIDDALCHSPVDEDRRHSLLAVESLARLEPNTSEGEGLSCDQVHGFILLRCLNEALESRTLRIQSCRHACKCRTGFRRHEPNRSRSCDRNSPGRRCSHLAELDPRPGRVWCYVSALFRSSDRLTRLDPP